MKVSFHSQLVAVFLTTLTFASSLQATTWEQTNVNHEKTLHQEAVDKVMNYDHYKESIDRFKAHMLLKKDDGTMVWVHHYIVNHPGQWHSSNATKDAELQEAYKYILQYGTYALTQRIASNAISIRNGDTTTRIGYQYDGRSTARLLGINWPVDACRGVTMATASIFVVAGVFALAPGGQPAAAVAGLFGLIIGLSARQFCP